MTTEQLELAIPAKMLARRIITDSGCWLWTGCRNNYGYGEVRYKGQVYYVHRLVVALVRGYLPPRKYVLHRCDVPACWNPEHLQVGTQSTNLKQMYRRGRRKRPEGIFT